jgi:hypothetical protein
MRIIITKQGDETLKKVAEDEQIQSLKEEEEKILKKKQEKPVKKKVEADNVLSFKEISVKQVAIAKQITEKYNNDYKTSMIIPSLHITRNEDENSLAKNFKLREIFQKTAIDNLKNEIVFTNRLRDKLSKVDEKNFRSLYVSKTKLNILDEKLNHEVNFDKMNLIKYLNQKERISEKLVDKIKTADETKESKINKICQIVFQKDEDYNNFNQTLKHNIQNSKNKEKVEYKAELNRMGNCLKTFTSVFNRYPRPENSREKFKDKHIDIEKNFWKKYHVNRLQRTKWKYNSQNSSTDDTYNISNL